MLGNFLFSFFIGMPAVVMFAKRNSMHHPVSRTIFTWGGAVAVILASIVVFPLLACKGSLISSYGNCFGGGGLSALVAQAQPLILLAAKLYILVGIPLAVLTVAFDQSRQA